MKYLLLIFTVTLLYSSAILSQECDWCKRRAILSEVKNDIVEGSDKMHASSIYGVTYQAVSPPCFYWLATPDILKKFEGIMPEKEILEYNMKYGKPPEYIFKALFESGLTGVTKPKKVILSTDTTDYVEATSRFTMKLYYNGETEELVDKWVTLGTKNRVSSHYQSMCKNKDSEMKKKNPLDVMYEFEQIPTECSVNPESETIHINNTMEIDITDFEGYYGGKPKHFNRIIVHALYGTVTNGSECDIGPDYKVFTLDDGLVTVNYQAPGNCETKNDRITVFNSCDILPPSKWPMKKTAIKDRIIEKNIDVICDWEWSGTMTVEKLERFDCELEVSKDNFWKLENFHELSTTRATVSIQAENIDDSPPGFNINMGENLIVSGFMKCEYNNTEVSDAEKTGLSAYTSHHEESLVGEKLVNLTHENVNINIISSFKNLEEDGSLKELEKMLDSGELDMSKIEEFGKKYEESIGMDEEGESPVTIMVQVFGDCKANATLTKSSWGIKKGKKTSTNESETFELYIGGGLVLEFEGTYTKGKDGSATITGSYSKPTDNVGSSKEGCPDRTVMNTCSINLSKRPKK